MKAVILAAGKGVRMGDLTKDIPKPLIKISGKPFLKFVIEALQNAGYCDIIIVAGYKKDMIEKFLQDFSIKANIVVQKEQLGTGHAVLLLKENIQEQFLLVPGDNLVFSDDLKKFSKEDDFVYVGAFEVENPEKYGVLVLDNGHIKEIIEKPATLVSNIINTGVYKLTPDIFKKLELVTKSERGEIELTDAINLLCRESKVKTIPVQSWLDLGCPDDIEKISKALGEKNS